jgi:carboxypeptidase Taq
MAKTFQTLLGRMQELKDLSGLVGLATWDQETYLPAKAELARGAQLGTLQGLYHERLTDPAVGEWLAAAEAEDLTDDQKAMLRVFRQERDRAVKVPKRLVQAIAEAQSAGLAGWRAAREAKQFAPFQAALKRLLELRREQADALGHDGTRYDALLEAYEPGMRVARLAPVLTALKEKLVPLIGPIEEASARHRSKLEGRSFAKDGQWDFSMQLLRAMGFDFGAGRQDLSVHPFTGGSHPLDVRLTNRIQEHLPLSSIFSAVHEGGHGLFEQGFAEADWRTPLAASPSMGLHESQSRLWENLVGRSRPFWTHFFPELQKRFPTELADVTVEDWLREANRVSRSLVRVEADEVTYNLHIVLRFELEQLLLDDALPLGELPSAWNQKMETLLGVRPKNDLEGVLQDIHWAWGELGYFPTYALGNLYSASLFAAARRALPDLEGRIEKGELLPLREWLRENVHAPGYRLPAEDRVRAITREGLTDRDFIAYLKSKYGALYGVTL